MKLWKGFRIIGLFFVFIFNEARDTIAFPSLTQILLQR